MSTILVAGGTTEGRELSLALLEAGYRVVLSQGTQVPFEIAAHPRLMVRHGDLDSAGFVEIIRQLRVCAVVDAAHPFASELRRTLLRVTSQLGHPYCRLARQSSPLPKDCAIVRSHRAAAELACRMTRCVLLTVGTRQLLPYVIASHRHKTRLYARVLEHEASTNLALRLGLCREQLLLGKGPFSFQDNLAALRQTKADTLVTKDSGEPGGLYEKIRATRALRRHLVVVARPPESGDVFETIEAVLSRLSDLLGRPS